MSRRRTLKLFEGIGIELEYMIVDTKSLSVRALTDQVLHSATGAYEQSFEHGEISWSNELALHVIELKTTGVATDLAAAVAPFARNIAHINQILAPMTARLLPTAMHPWMDPDAEMKLWPHGDDEIYAAFHRIFDCRGHGWANLQSMHINLPFCGDDEFGRLHAAIRLLLPILPALAASSPFCDGATTGLLDTRLEVYRHNAARVPSLSGAIVPEPVFTHAAYQEMLAGLYRDIAPHDPDGILQEEWLNARGAIARFDRNAIEIRVLDVQECPLADLAIASAIVEILKAMVQGRVTPLAEQMRWSEHTLAAMLPAVMAQADDAMINDTAYLAALGIAADAPMRAGDIWRELIAAHWPRSGGNAELGAALDLILDQGCLSRRILRATGADPTRDRLAAVYEQLAECLARGRLFDSPGTDGET